MSAIHRRVEGSIVILQLNRPPVNALDVETLNELSDAIDEARENDVEAAVITGTGKVFSAGADLLRVLESEPGDVDEGIDALTRNFRALFTFPRPLIAAVNGHALAGGAVITCACDHRVMGRHGRIGAVELAAGVPFPSWALEVVRHNVPEGHFQEVVLLGRAYRPPEALRLGLIDEVAEGDVLRRGLEVANEMAQVPRRTYALTKQMARAASVAAADRGAKETDEDVKAAWNSDEVRAAIRRRIESLGRS